MGLSEEQKELLNNLLTNVHNIEGYISHSAIYFTPTSVRCKVIYEVTKDSFTYPPDIMSVCYDDTEGFLVL